MKAFLAITLALFALSAHAFNPNMTEYLNGFSDKLGLDVPTLAEDTASCADGLTQATQDINDAIKGLKEGDIEGFLSNLLSLVIDVKDGALGKACENYELDVVAYFWNHTNSSEANDVFSTNSEKYRANLIQQAVEWLNYFLDDHEYEAGQTHAYIYQILANITTPPEIPLNVTDNHSTQNDTNVAFAQGFLSFFNITDEKQVGSFAECWIAFDNAGQAISDFEMNYDNLTNLADKIELIRATIGITLDAVRTCGVGSGDALDQIYGDLWDFGKKYPLSTLEYLFWDFTIKLPEIESTYISAIFDMLFKGNYEGAGWLIAEDSKMITDLFYDIN